MKSVSPTYPHKYMTWSSNLSYPWSNASVWGLKILQTAKYGRRHTDVKLPPSLPNAPCVLCVSPNQKGNWATLMFFLLLWKLQCIWTKTNYQGKKKEIGGGRGRKEFQFFKPDLAQKVMYASLCKSISFLTHLLLQLQNWRGTGGGECERASEQACTEGHAQTKESKVR